MSAHVSSGYTYLAIAGFHASVSFGCSLFDASSKETLASFASNGTKVNARRWRFAHRTGKTLEQFGHCRIAWIFIDGHSDFFAFLKATVLTLFSICFINDTNFFFIAHIFQFAKNASSKKTFTSFT